MYLQKESEWKDEFYRRFQEEYPHLSDEQSEEIKTFISNIISNREKEIAEEVKKIDINILDDEYIDAKTFRNKVIQILEH